MTPDNQDDEYNKLIQSLLADGKRIYGAKTTFNTEEKLAPGTNEALAPFSNLIARIGNQWGLFEMSLDDMLWKLADVTPSYGACLTSHMGSAYQKIKAVVALLVIWPETDPLVTKIVTAQVADSHEVVDCGERGRFCRFWALAP